MALRNIRINDDPILRKVCKPVQEITKKTEEYPIILLTNPIISSNVMV